MSLKLKEARKIANKFMMLLPNLEVSNYNELDNNLVRLLQEVHNMGFDKGCEETSKAIEGTYLDKNI